MPTENSDAIQRANNQLTRNTEGVAMDPLGLALLKPTKEFESEVLSLPSNELGDDEPLQDPATGRFYFMLDVDDIDSGAPLA